MFIEIILMIVGLVLLIKGSDYFVKSAAIIAKHFGVSEFIIGLTLVALGTSLPELVSAVIASFGHESGLIMGTLVGANIANLTMIIGIAAIVATITTNKHMLRREGYIMFFVFLILFILISDSILSRFEGIVLVVLFLTYTLFLFDSRPDKPQGFVDFAGYVLRFGYLQSLTNKVFSSAHHKNNDHSVSARVFWKQCGLIVLCIVCIVVGAEFVVGNAVYFATYFSVPQAAIGVLVAIGTTMPELSVALSAARQRMGNIVIGNAIGSCLTNVLLIMGVSSIIHPVEIASISIIFVVPYLLLVSLFLLLFMKSKWRVTKKEGVLLIALYMLFLILLFMGNARHIF